MHGIDKTIGEGKPAAEYTVRWTGSPEDLQQRLDATEQQNVDMALKIAGLSHIVECLSVRVRLLEQRSDATLAYIADVVAVTDPDFPCGRVSLPEGGCKGVYEYDAGDRIKGCICQEPQQEQCAWLERQARAFERLKAAFEK
jgi:hypothetical protein